MTSYILPQPHTQLPFSKENYSTYRSAFGNNIMYNERHSIL